MTIQKKPQTTDIQIQRLEGEITLKENKSCTIKYQRQKSQSDVSKFVLGSLYFWIKKLIIIVYTCAS